MAKWTAAEKARAGLRHAVVCPNVTGRTKERIAQSKRARTGSLAIVNKPQVARICILQANVVLSFSGVTFVFVLFRYHGLRPFWFLFLPFFCFFGDVVFFCFRSFFVP